MKFNKIPIFVVAIAGIGASSAVQAQSISSFQLAQINGVSSTLLGMTLTTSVFDAPTLKIGATTYAINSVFAVYSLDDNDDLTASGGAVPSGWSFNSNYSGVGGIAGWKNNPNSGLIAGQSKSYTYTSYVGSAEAIGYHIRVDGTLPGGGNTAYFRPQAVPEPGSLAALVLGGACIIRRRK